jgi:hypothetical protein
MAVKDKLVELGMLVVGLVFDKLAWPVILEFLVDLKIIFNNELYEIMNYLNENLTNTAY